MAAVHRSRGEDQLAAELYLSAIDANITGSVRPYSVLPCFSGAANSTFSLNL